jgi:hypothetical protein
MKTESKLLLLLGSCLKDLEIKGSENNKKYKSMQILK